MSQDETDSIAETEADRDMKRERDHDGDREAAGAINLTSRWIKIMMVVAMTFKAHKTNIIEISRNLFPSKALLCPNHSTLRPRERGRKYFLFFRNWFLSREIYNFQCLFFLCLEICVILSDWSLGPGASHFHEPPTGKLSSCPENHHTKNQGWDLSYKSLY